MNLCQRLSLGSGIQARRFKSESQTLPKPVEGEILNRYQLTHSYRQRLQAMPMGKSGRRHTTTHPRINGAEVWIAFSPASSFFLFFLIGEGICFLLPSRLLCRYLIENLKNKNPHYVRHPGRLGHTAPQASQQLRAYRGSGMKVFRSLLVKSPAAAAEGAALVQLHLENASKPEHIFLTEKLSFLPPALLPSNELKSPFPGPWHWICLYETTSNILWPRSTRLLPSSSRQENPSGRDRIFVGGDPRPTLMTGGTQSPLERGVRNRFLLHPKFSWSWNKKCRLSISAQRLSGEPFSGSAYK